MSTLKRLARAAAGAILVTGVLAGFTAPAQAANPHGSNGGAGSVVLDTGWD
jgi:hypothetical protein